MTLELVVVQGGAVTTLLGVVWLIVTGRLVPRSALLDAQQERDTWKEAHALLVQQNAQLLIGARVATDVIRAMPDPAGERT